jgi:hypothetical protein
VIPGGGRRAIAICAISAFLSAGLSEPVRATSGSPLGTNLAQVTDFTAEYPFVNFFKQARTWISGTPFQFDDGRSLDVDKNGYVTKLKSNQVARALLFTGLPRDPDLDGRRFVLRFDGEGSFAYSGATAEPDDDANRDVIELGSGGPGEEATIEITLVSTNPSNYVRNIRLTPLGGICELDPMTAVEGPGDCPSDQFLSFEDDTDAIRFNPEFLSRIDGFRSLRFMDWMRTNNSKQIEFADRPRVKQAFWSTKAGVPLEVMIDLANRLEVDPWFNIPHKASDDYVRRFAGVVRDRMDVGRVAYFEYSNEVWNGIFKQTAYAENQGAARGFDTDSDTTVGMLRFYSVQSPKGVRSDHGGVRRDRPDPAGHGDAGGDPVLHGHDSELQEGGSEDRRVRRRPLLRTHGLRDH